MILPKAIRPDSVPTRSKAAIDVVASGYGVKRPTSLLYSSLPLIPRFSVSLDQPQQMSPFLETLQHFSTVTYCTLGSDMGRQILCDTLLNITALPAYLTHAIHGVAAGHLCYLLPADVHPQQHYRHQLAESYHWQKALHLLREELRRGATFQNMDHLLSAIMLVAVRQFMVSSPDSEIAQSFVNAPENQRKDLLRWLSINAGFQALEETLGGGLEQSIWQPVIQDAESKECSPQTVDQHSYDDTDRLFIEICDIDSSTTSEENPYYVPLQYLLFLRRMRPSIKTFHKLVTFVGAVDFRFNDLLCHRDKRALLILAHWLASMTEIRQWWLEGRTRIECVAIVQFLQNDSDARVRKLLAYPARIMGLPSPDSAVCYPTATLRRLEI